MRLTDFTEAKIIIDSFLKNKNTVSFEVEFSVFYVLEYFFEKFKHSDESQTYNIKNCFYMDFVFEDNILSLCAASNLIILKKKIVNQETLISLNYAKILINKFINTNEKIAFKANFPICEVVDYCKNKFGDWIEINMNNSGSCHDIWYTYTKKYILSICTYCRHVKLYLDD